MRITIDVPDDLFDSFATDAESLARATREALALEGIRSGKLTEAQGRRMLGIPSRYEMDGFLKAHGIMLDITLDDIRRETEASAKFSR